MSRPLDTTRSLSTPSSEQHGDEFQRQAPFDSVKRITRSPTPRPAGNPSDSHGALPTRAHARTFGDVATNQLPKASPLERIAMAAAERVASSESPCSRANPKSSSPVKLF